MEDITFGSADEVIVTVLTIKRILSPTPIDSVILRSTENRIRAVAAANDIVTGVSTYQVCPSERGNIVVPPAPANDVIAALSIDGVRVVRAANDVIPGSTVDYPGAIDRRDIGNATDNAGQRGTGRPDHSDHDSKGKQK